MNRVLIKLYVPILEEKYDVWIPINKKIYKVIELMVKILNEITKDCYKPKKMPLLYDKSTAKPYDLNSNAKENKIKNGTEIILI